MAKTPKNITKGTKYPTFNPTLLLSVPMRKDVSVTPAEAEKEKIERAKPIFFLILSTKMDCKVGNIEA